MTLKPYIIFSNSDSEGCAGLVFAHNHQEARVTGWGCFKDEVTDEYIDIAANLMRNADYLRDEVDPALFEKDEPFGFYPKGCERCEHWGVGPIGADNLCGGCRADDAQEINAGEVYVD